MPEDKVCVFCKIVRGELPSWKVLEDERHLAFLDAFPLVKGQTVVITKKHYNSYHFNLPDDVYAGLFVFAKKVAVVLDKGLRAERCMLVAQGYAINHIHVKLFPVLKVNKTAVEQETYDTLTKMLDKDWYGGYIISMSGKRQASKEELDDVLKGVAPSR
ncbi:MAG: HIT domain-containing protein [Candidatus Micrarchaeota archaeon]|nr:HIT domain-containing protein [Candidatus Micrarchaeota archaeon]